jgi:hypothetical protein
MRSATVSVPKLPPGAIREPLRARSKPSALPVPVNSVPAWRIVVPIPVPTVRPLSRITTPSSIRNSPSKAG